MIKNSLAEFMTHLFDAWGAEDIQYLILRNYEELPEFTGNDIDILLDPHELNKAKRLLCRTAGETGWKIHNVGEFSCTAFYLYNETSLEQVHLDLMCQLKWYVFPFLNDQPFRKGRVPYKNFYVPASNHEAAESLLTPLLYGGQVKEKYRDGIRRSALGGGECLVDLLSPWLGKELASELVSDSARGEWKRIESRTGSVRKKVLFSNLKNPCRVVCALCQDLSRLFRRLLRSPGVSIVFFGPDGCGKTSVANGLKQHLQKTFYQERSIHCHWKPVRQKGEGVAPNEDPHARPARNPALSLAYFIYHYLPFIWGWWLHIKPVLFRDGLVIIDRYYYDFFVDLRRYRLNLPQWIVKLGFVFVKKPDLVFCLDAAPEVLQARKKEVSFEECKRQREAYRELATTLPNGQVIDAAQPLEQVVADVQRVVLEYMAGRTSRRMRRR
jgi:thymidylate kinase